MLRTNAPISQRLIRKGPLVEETYTLFRNWKDEMSFDQNFEYSLHGSFRSEAWKKEVHATLRRRFRDLKAANCLIVLARGGYGPSDWRYCLHFWIATHETLYKLFLATCVPKTHYRTCWPFGSPEIPEARPFQNTEHFGLRETLCAWQEILVFSKVKGLQKRSPLFTFQTSCFYIFVTSLLRKRIPRRGCFQVSFGNCFL